MISSDEASLCIKALFARGIKCHLGQSTITGDAVDLMLSAQRYGVRLPRLLTAKEQTVGPGTGVTARYGKMGPV
ncbi:hypothetical protein RRG08_051877 [Elysia crispata]|uniref:Uncharacterized protein n=1 Tax=Elysia crispata TaxID=231223 RepID=A0AAE1DCT7_9GAST|nr:hypothetical protein RRG08_051877 [Elysia crispata]